jgi:DNA polymerase-3 subunit beta
MKFSTLQENLKQGLFIASHVAGKNTNLPILNNVLIEAKDGNIKLITTNLEVGIITTIRGKVEKDGSFAVDAKIFTDYVGLLANEKIDIDLKENKLNIEIEKNKTKITGQSPEEFPLIPVVSRDLYYSAKIEDFKKALLQVIFSVSTSESRIELSGVLFNFFNNKLIVAATDSYRLAEKEINIKTNKNDAEEKRVIIPAKTIQEVIRILGGGKDNEKAEGGEIKFYLSDNQILFVVGATELVSRLIEGQYPDYKQIIPTTSKTNALINKTKLIRMIKIASLFSRANVNDVNLDFPIGKGQVIISSTSGQTGENITEMEALVNGEDNGIVINYRYLLDGLNNIEGDNVKLEIIDSNTPCVIRPEEEKNYLYIIMPIKQ